MRELVPLAFAGIVLLTGCANARSMMIAEDTALVTVVGQSANGRANAVDKALAEAARITREHGFRYFVVLDSADASQSGIRRLPGQQIPFQLPNRRSNFSLFYPPGATYTTPDMQVQYVTRGLDFTIRMYRQGEVNPESQGVWSSDIVLGGGTDQHGSKPKP